MVGKKVRCHPSIIIENVWRIVIIFAVICIGQIDEVIDGIQESKGYGVLVALCVFGLLIIVACLFSFFRWRKTTVTIENDALIWERDTINRKILTINLSNISSINLERNIIERVLGTARLKLDTNSLSTASKTDVSLVYKLSEAEEYKHYIEDKVKNLNNACRHADIDIQNSEGCNVCECEEDVEIASYTTNERDIFMHSVYGLSVFAVILFLFMAASTIITTVTAATGHLGASIAETLATIVTLIVMSVSILSSIVRKFFVLYKLSVSRKGNYLKMKYGMFKVQEYTLPVNKINAISINQTMIGRIFGKYNVTMEIIGVGDESKENAQLTLSLGYAETLEKIHSLLPEYDLSTLDIAKPISKKARLNKICASIPLLLFLTVSYIAEIIFFNVCDILEDLTMVVIIEGAVMALMYIFELIVIARQMKTEAVGLGEKNVALTTGAFGRNTVIMEYGKIQYIATRKNLIGRVNGLSNGTVRILSKVLRSAQRIPYVDDEQLQMLEDKVLDSTRC